MKEITLTNTPEQLFTISIAKTVYQLKILFNSRTRSWSMNINTETGAPIISGIALVGGVDMLDAYNLPFQNMVVINTDDTNLDPTLENLGETSRLVIFEEGDF